MRLAGKRGAEIERPRSGRGGEDQADVDQWAASIARRQGLVEFGEKYEAAMILFGAVFHTAIKWEEDKDRDKAHDACQGDAQGRTAGFEATGGTRGVRLNHIEALVGTSVFPVFSIVMIRSTMAHT